MLSAHISFCSITNLTKTSMLEVMTYLARNSGLTRLSVCPGLTWLISAGLHQVSVVRWSVGGCSLLTTRRLPAPPTTPTPTLLLLVFMGATWNHSLDLMLYASTEDSPVMNKAQCASSPPQVPYIYIREILQLFIFKMS